MAEPVIAQGEWRGRILRARRGDGGFGYDPLFYVPELGKSSAELSPDEKNARSHRGQALAELSRKLHEIEWA
jgi:XTP/dITP diphosphohydrolase